jgi:hypothetical protein
MKKAVFIIIGMLSCAFAFCAVPDSTAANLTGQVLGGLYNYLAPTLSLTVKQCIAGIVTATPVILLALQVVFKKVPQLAPIDGYLGFVLDTLTWYVKNTTQAATDAPAEALKKN